MCWSTLGVACFFLLGVRVHSKGGGGCFDPTMQVTMADGSRKALNEVQFGDEVKSWNFKTDSPTTSTVVDILRFYRESLMELRLETGSTIYSTDDHPYWSHAKQCIVSRDPSSTLALYEIHASQLDDEEVFMSEDRKPVAGRVSFSRRTASIIMDGVDVPDSIEVMTLRLNESHWFYVEGILVHNKGDDEEEEKREKSMKCGGPKLPCVGGRAGGVDLGVHNYRRRRRTDFVGYPECFIIDKSNHQCHDDENWDEDACKKASEQEYMGNQACYDCEDDECIKKLCDKKSALMNNETCGGWEQKQEDDKIKDECLSVNGTCDATAYETCCACIEKMKKNVLCDEEVYDPSNFPVIVACMGAAAFVLAGIYLAITKFKEARKAKEDARHSAYEDQRTAPEAACGTVTNPEAFAPSSGKWTSMYQEKGHQKSSSYSIEFLPDGQIRGNGKDANGPFKIEHGVYNVNTRKVMWQEVGGGWTCEVSLSYTDGDIMKGTYLVNNGVEDSVTFSLDSAVDNGASLIGQSQHQKPPTKSQVVPVHSPPEPAQFSSF